ncbi:MAG TPA: hypothetical protein VGP54_00160 [Gaiellaceae bacterium]|nr:hypothetical protein [Gaiellaceae bacterium]
MRARSYGRRRRRAGRRSRCSAGPRRRRRPVTLHRSPSAGIHRYTGSCTGHDEPEIDPLSNGPGSAQDLTWTIVLPTNAAGTSEAQVGQVDSVGPTFWIGGTVTDPNSRFGQAFLELQFYPNSITTNCAAGGGYNVTYSANTYSACSPVWEVSQKGNSESAATRSPTIST